MAAKRLREKNKFLNITLRSISLLIFQSKFNLISMVLRGRLGEISEMPLLSLRGTSVSDMYN
jgi:hypothetical protein